MSVSQSVQRLRVPSVPLCVRLAQRRRVVVGMKQEGEQTVSMRAGGLGRHCDRVAMRRDGLVVPRLPFIDAREVALRRRRCRLDASAAWNEATASSRCRAPLGGAGLFVRLGE
jgi:hypothetical protein